jgi:hypothetical protein
VRDFKPPVRISNRKAFAKPQFGFFESNRRRNETSVDSPRPFVCTFGVCSPESSFVVTFAPKTTKLLQPVRHPKLRQRIGIPLSQFFAIMAKWL